MQVALAGILKRPHTAGISLPYPLGALKGTCSSRHVQTPPVRERKDM